MALTPYRECSKTVLHDKMIWLVLLRPNPSDGFLQERHHAKTVGEIKQFVSQLPHMQAARSSLANHTSIAELIKDITSE